jgi:hypothetical protein
MKRAAAWLFYAVGALAVAYLALYAYVTFTGQTFVPGDPIHIFRKPGGAELGLLKTSAAPVSAVQETKWLASLALRHSPPRGVRLPLPA